MNALVLRRLAIEFQLCRRCNLRRLQIEHCLLLGGRYLLECLSRALLRLKPSRDLPQLLRVGFFQDSFILLDPIVVRVVLRGMTLDDSHLHLTRDSAD